MAIRSLDILDIPLIARYRNDALTLDSTRALTRGHPLGAASLLAYVNPTRHMYAAVANGNGGADLVGGVIHSRGETYAKLLYLAPASRLDHAALPGLVEHLVMQVGEWGAFHVSAEIDESSDAFPALRQTGFSVYAWQRMWDISEINSSTEIKDWTRARSVNRPALQSLYHQIVPQLMHPVEPLSKKARGLICDGEVKCYVSLAAGAQGIVISPLIHPEAKNVDIKLASLLNCIPDRRGRPVYLCVRSYQAWLEPALADMGAKSGPRQAVMVKHLARLIKDEQTVPAVPSGVSVQPSRVSRIKWKEND